MCALHSQIHYTYVNTAQVLDGACIMYTHYTLHVCQLYQIKCLIHSFKSTKILGSYKKKTLKLKVEYVCPLPMRIQ
jgi:hypothetical protein